MSQNAVHKQSRMGATVHVYNGNMESDEDLTIDGNMTLDSINAKSNTLTIGKTSNTEANLSGDVVIVLGNVSGDITATSQIKIEAGASVNGDLTAPKFFIHSDGVFQGKLVYSHSE